MRPQEEEVSTQEGRRERRPSLLAVTIVRKETNVNSSIGAAELCNRIYGGVLRRNIKMKFWVDENLDKNCFLLLAKELSIIWIDDRRYWRWIDEKITCYDDKVDVDVAELLGVCWLKISGKFKTIELCPMTTYQVAFVVKMSERSSGWHHPVKLNLTLPDKTTQGRVENLEEMEKGKWIDILVGTFKTSPENVGEMSFSLSETGDHWKYGLLVKGVVLRPKD